MRNMALKIIDNEWFAILTTTNYLQGWSIKGGDEPIRKVEINFISNYTSLTVLGKRGVVSLAYGAYTITR